MALFTSNDQKNLTKAVEYKVKVYRYLNIITSYSNSVNLKYKNYLQNQKCNKRKGLKHFQKQKHPKFTFKNT